MLWCNDCQAAIEEEDAYIEINHDANRGHGDIEFADGEYRCPGCDSTLITEAERCDGCNDWFDPSKTYRHKGEDFCPDCLAVTLVCEQEHIFRSDIYTQLTEILGVDFDSDRMWTMVRDAFSECFGIGK